MNYLRLLGISLAAVAAATAGSANASVVFSQPYDGGSNAYSSQNDTNSFGNFATVYDNFTLAGTATIGNVAFTGGFFNPNSPGPITGFTVNFYSNAGGQPGALLSSTAVSGDGHQALIGDTGGVFMANYSVDTNFTATGGTQYWLSVVPTLGFPPQWGWAQSGTGDGVEYQDFFGSRSQVGSDAAFTLSTATSAVPESSTWAMMILGVGMIGGTMRRRRSFAKASLA